MLNEYKDKIELQKEVLAALPRNNNKNNKLYKAKVEEMLKEYQVDKEVVEEEITKRRNRYLSLEEDPNIDKLTKNIELLLPQIPLLNKYNSSYEKSNLDIILYELGHFYKTDLDKVNKDINRALEVFSLVGIPLSIEDFNYSYYSGNYMKRFLSNEVNDDILKKDFEEIYWKCPDIITHITLNFKYLYYKNKKKFDLYYDHLVKELTSKKVLEEYQELCAEKSDDFDMFGNNSDEIIILLELIAKKRGVKKQGNILDIDKICGIILEEFCMKKGDTSMSEKSTFYLVREEILPEAIKKTIKVKEILKRGEIKTINEAVEKMGLSRSAYYKYKDFVFPFYEASKEKIITLSLLLEHKSGVLSKVLNTVADDSGSIMTINQGIPLQGVANTTISIETKHLTVDLEALLDKLRMIDGVKRLEVLGQV